MQLNSDDCGPASLATVCQYYRNQTPVDRLRHLMNVHGGRTVLIDLVDAAQAVGFEAKAFRADWTGLGQLTFPLIAHWEGRHYVVVWEVDRSGRVLVGDPAIGDRWISRSEFEAGWQGVVVELRPSDRLQDWNVAGSLEFLKELLAPQLRDWRMHGPILGLSIAMAGFGLVLPGFVRWIIDDLVGKSTSPLSLTAILYVLIVAMLLQAGMFFVREYSVGKAVAALTRKMSLDYLDKVTHTRVQELSSWGLGDLLTRFSDVSQIQGIFTKFLVETSFGVLLLCGTAMFVGWKAKEFLWLLLLPTPAMFVVIRFLHPQLRIALCAKIGETPALLETYVQRAEKGEVHVADNWQARGWVSEQHTVPAAAG